MPEMSDIFVLQANASEVVAAMATADAAVNQSKAVLRSLAKESVAGQKELIGALGEVSDTHVALTGKIREVDRAYKEWTQAAAKGSADVAAKEAEFKATLAEVQQLTMRNATVSVAAKEQIVAAAQKQAAAEESANKEAEHMAVIQHAGAIVVDDATARKIEQYAKLKKEEAELRAAMARTNSDVEAGVPNAAKAYGVLSARLQDVTKRQNELSQTTGVVNGKAVNMNFILGQLSYGAQDLVTVLSQPGMGLSDALRSTANNLGVVAQVAGGPLYGTLATVGIMAAAFGAKMLEAGDSAKKAKVDSEDFNDTLRAIASTAKDSTDEINQLIKAQIDLGDVEFQKKMAPMREQKKAADTKVEQEEANVKYYQDQLEKENAANPFGARKTSGVIEGYKKRLEAAKKERAAIDQNIKDAENIHNAAEAAIANRKAVREAEKSIDDRFGRVDEPLKSTARVEAGMADAFGSIDDEAAIDRIINQSGITPANDAEKKRLRERAKGLLDKSKEQMTSDSERNRLMSRSEREKRDAEFRRGIVNERREELMRPVVEQERRLQEQRDDLNRSRWQATRPDSPGGKRVTLDEQRELDAKQESLDANTRAHHETKAAIERLIESLKENSAATKEDTKTTEGHGGGVGFRLALNPFAGIG